VLENTRELQ